MDHMILVDVRKVYGALKAYPANAQAQNLAALVGTKTLTGSALRIALDMGFEIRATRALCGLPIQRCDLAALD